MDNPNGIHRRPTHNTDPPDDTLPATQPLQRDLVESGSGGTLSQQDRDVEKAFTTSPPPPDTSPEDRYRGFRGLYERFRARDKTIPSTWTSIKNIFFHSPIMILLVFVPISWVAHFIGEHEIHAQEEDPTRKVRFSGPVQFALSFLAIIPLEKTFDWLGEEMIVYLGAELGEVLEITLNNSVEAALGIFLLTKDKFRLLQTTIIGVLLLHLLLIPGVAFFTGGARIWEQQMHRQTTELNHSLLTIGVMALVLPAAFFAALDRGTLADLTHQVTQNVNATASSGFTTVAETATSVAAAFFAEVTGEPGHSAESKSAAEHINPRELIPLLSDTRRGEFLKFSRAIALILLAIYIGSRVFLHNPPGEDNALSMQRTGPEAMKKRAEKLELRQPLVNQGIAIATLVITVGLMAVTAEWLVDSVELVQEESGILEEWLGLILLPFVSFAADGLITVIYFVQKLVMKKVPSPETFTRGLAIDLSIQFILFWMPFFVLIAWWTHKPLTLLFDFFEIAALVASCFLVNYVTADAKTNWIEGMIMVGFYAMIGIVAWFYPGQVEVKSFVVVTSVSQAITEGAPIE